MPTLETLRTLDTLRMEVPMEPKPRCMPHRSSWDAQPQESGRCPRGYPVPFQNSTWKAPCDDPLPDLPPKVNKPQLTLFLAAPKHAPSKELNPFVTRPFTRKRRARSADSALPLDTAPEDQLSCRGAGQSQTLPRMRAVRAAERNEAIKAIRALALPKVETNSTTNTPRSRRNNSTGTLRRCNSSGFATLTQSCPVCFGDLRANHMESIGCGVHHMCGNCAQFYASTEVRNGRLPRCTEPKCRQIIEPLVALRLLSENDHNLYLQMALWLNPQIEACPKCHAILFSEVVAPCGQNARCPSCAHVFCADCRQDVHPGMSCEDQYIHRLSNTANDTRDLQAFGCKPCPRCRFPGCKADEQSCDHMTCGRCHHEFCWQCSADRAVIYAHGNHFHRMHCKFFAEYKGPEEYLPHTCARCQLRGSACRAPAAHTKNESPSTCSVAYIALSDAFSSWAKDAFNTTMNSNFVRVHVQNKLPLGPTERSL